MPRPGKLGAYLAPARARPDDGAAPLTPRPGGELVWLHATDRTHADVALQLARRLAGDRPGIHMLLTTEPGAAPRNAPPDSVIMAGTPADTGAAAQAFLEHWTPDLCIWTGGDLKPSLLGFAHRRGIPLYLVDADEARLARPGWRWLPDTSRLILKRFTMIMACNTATETFLRRRLGLRDPKIAATGALREEAKPLPYNESDHEELTGLLRGRPVWLAAHLQPEEIGIVLDANSRVTRLSHRALLVIVPADPEDSQPFHDALGKSGLRYITWSEGTLPDEATHAILVDTSGELGLWYRIAPISFMGGSLCEGAHGSDPGEPAAHGSAILYGPNIRSYLAAYSRYAEAGAARIVRDADTLSAAIQRIIPPDQSASMAHAAWDVATQSAAVMDRLVEVVIDALDERAAS